MHHLTTTRFESALLRMLLVGIAMTTYPAGAAAQDQIFTACYVPEVGAVYMIKLQGLPNECLSTSHQEVSWTDGAGGTLDLGSVGSAELADGAVQSSKLALGAVTRDRLAVDAVASDRIADSTVTGTDIAGSAVTSEHLADRSVKGHDLDVGYEVVSATLPMDAATVYAGLKCPSGKDVLSTTYIFLNPNISDSQRAPTVFQSSINATGNGWSLVLLDPDDTQQEVFISIHCVDIT